MTEKEQYTIILEKIVGAEDLWEAIKQGDELLSKYKEDGLELQGVMKKKSIGDVE